MGTRTGPMLPVWLDRPRAAHPPLTGTSRYDVVVVGGGLTGLLTAVLLARAGSRVAVLEARQVGDGTTGHTTAKVSVLQGTRLSHAARTNPASVVRDYVTANQEGLAWLRRFCEDHDVPFQTRPAYTYATTQQGEAKARAELATAQAAGLEATWQSESELPFAIRGAVRLDDQLQLHPMDLLDAVVAELVAEGGELFERSRVLDVDRTGDGVVVRTDGATATATAVVLATNQPILRRHAFFARLKAERSYCAALRSSWTPEGMYINSESPVRSLRSLPVDGEELLLIGGSGHGTGRSTSPQGKVDDLLGWARDTFPGSSVTHTWSAQDQVPVTGLPYVGPMLPRDSSIWVATGFAKWGFTNAPAAALLLSKSILSETMGGEPPPWRGALASWTPREAAAGGRALFYNAEVGAFIAEGLARPLRASSSPPEEGKGVVRYDGIRPVAVSKVDGVEHRVSAVCPHLKGIVRWNDAERSWDCPLHGSRFAPDGQVLEGPTMCGLKRLGPAD